MKLWEKPDQNTKMNVKNENFLFEKFSVLQFFFSLLVPSKTYQGNTVY
jgi:hypothetical protein